MNAIDQLDRAEEIIQKLDRNVRHAIYLGEYFARGAYNGNAVRKHFDNSTAAHGYNLVLDSLYFELVLTMARLYDDPVKGGKADNTASVPIVMEILLDPLVMEELRKRLMQRHAPGRSAIGPDGSTIALVVQMAEKGVEEKLNAIGPLRNTYKGHHLLQRIRTARNEFMAHTAMNPSKNNRVAYGDAEQLLALTIPIVKQLQYSVRSTGASYDREREIAVETSDSFWKKIVSS